MGRYQDPFILERAGLGDGSRVMRAVREAKRAEARERQARTVHDRTRAHRTGRCDCQALPPPEPAPGHPAPVRTGCPHPEKDIFTSGQAAGYILTRLAARRRNGGLKPYKCPAGDHWHLGRPEKRHPPSTWKRAA